MALTSQLSNINEFNSGNTERLESFSGSYAVGQWYWLSGVGRDDHWRKSSTVDISLCPDGYIDLLCIKRIGSNFIELTSVEVGRSGSYSCRCHFNEFEEKTKFEPHPEKYFQLFANHYRKNMESGMLEIAQINQRFALTSSAGKPLLQSEQVPVSAHCSETTAIVPFSLNADRLKQELIAIKENRLPQIKTDIEKANHHMAAWMSAPSFSLLLLKGSLDQTMSAITDKIHDVSLYAGVGENSVTIQHGTAAAVDEKIAIMQRRLYMDEEALVNYESGGMSFDQIDDFDQWLLKPDNLYRLMPFPRCVVAFRVRRNEKRNAQLTNRIISLFVQARIKNDDKLTFIYIRNGEQVSRLNTDLEFGEQLFENNPAFLTERTMLKSYGSDHMPYREWEERKALKERLVLQAIQWEKDNPSDDEKFSFNSVNDPVTQKIVYLSNKNPFYMELNKASLMSFYPAEWREANSDYLYLDEFVDSQHREMKQYNKIAIVLQGLIDRGSVFAPFPGVNLSNHNDFNRSVRLVFDSEMVLEFGKAPDFEAYRAELNSVATQNSVWVGQKMAWQKMAIEKEVDYYERAEKLYSVQFYGFTNRLGNSGPSLISKAERFSHKTGKVKFSWEYESETNRTYGQMRNASITVPVSELLNISAYQKGDFKRFFADHRTRAEYMKWAPLLFAAENYVSSLTSQFMDD